MSDITPGHTFAAGEQVTHTKLNTPPTIATAFYTGKSTLAAYDPNNCTLLVYDSGSGTFKRGTLAAAIFDNDALIKDRSAATTPTDAWLLPIQDPTGNIYKVTRANIFYQWLNLTGLLDAAGALGGTAGTALKVLVDGLTLEIATNALQLKDGGTELAKLSPAAKRNLAGALARFSRQVASGTAGETANTGALTALALNTTETNTLTGASLNTGTGVITLAAGRYEVSLEIPAVNTAGAQVELYDTGTGTVVSSVDSVPVRATGYTSGYGMMLTHTAVISLAASTTLALRAKAGSAGTWGAAATQGVPEHYQTITIRQAY